MFFGNRKWARKFIGGHWVLDRVDGFMWVRFEESILENYMSFESLEQNPRYKTEKYDRR